MEIIQLWSNFEETEFAIRPETEKTGFRALTNHNVRYVKVTDEIYGMDGIVIDWPFMLERWIIAYKEGFRHTDLRHQSKLHQLDWSYHHNNNIKSFSSTPRTSEKNKTKRRHKFKRRKPGIKCNFCNLMFINDFERTVHQKEWHNN
jgi:hypothetical protein